jgi:formimidoylglutamate deiminase
MTTYHVDALLAGSGWTHGAAITVSDAGLITAIEPKAAPDSADVHLRGAIVPGMPNAHSHAFQRAMAGDSEYRTASNESFWTWREAMYALANSVEPADLEAFI